MTMNQETIKKIASFICGSTDDSIPAYRNTREMVSFFSQFGIRYAYNPLEDLPQKYSFKVQNVANVLQDHKDKINDIVIYLAESRIYMDCNDYAIALRQLNQILATEGSRIQLVRSKPQLAQAS